MVQGRRNPFVAREGIPFLLADLVACWLAWRYLDIYGLIVASGLFVFLYLIFRDPHRDIPPAPLGVVSPVDGVIETIDRIETGALHGEAHRILIRIDALGTYTARCPAEGMVMDLNSIAGDKVVDYQTNALWVRTDEDDDVVLQFGGYRLGLAPKSFMRYGERLGQGARCAYLRLTRVAELHLPMASRVLVEEGQRVAAGSDLIAKFTHP